VLGVFDVSQRINMREFYRVDRRQKPRPEKQSFCSEYLEDRQMRGIFRAALVAIFLTGPGPLTYAALADQGGLASLYPGPSGQPSEKLQARWDAMSNRTLSLLLKCLEQLSLRKPEAALENCSQALQLDPVNASAHKLRGEAYFMLGDMARAKREFDYAVKFDPSDPESFAGRGDTHRNQGTYARAIADYTKAIALSPNDERLLMVRCWTRAIWAKDLDKALADCDHSLALNYEFALGYNARGLVYLRMNVLSLALRDYNEALRLQSEFPIASFGRGITHSRLRQYRAAHRDFAAARRLDPQIDAKYAAWGFRLQKAPSNRRPLCSTKPCVQTALTMTPRAIPHGTPAKSALAILAGRGGRSSGAVRRQLRQIGR
jgi:tetratricopeptide (TPR) repeat protein